MKKFMKEFREFALKGNMIDLAVGMIIGGAFSSIIQSLVDNILNPIIGLFAGKVDFNDLFISLDGNHYATLKAAEDAGAAVLRYGSFISAVINFLIMALVVFLLVKMMGSLRNKLTRDNAAAEAETPTTKICPFCKSEIDINATRCPHCTSVLDDVPEEGQPGAEQPEAAV